MALKPIEPRTEPGAALPAGALAFEHDRYARDKKHAQENPHLWANGPEHVPEILTKRTTVEEIVRRPQGRDADAASERPVVIEPGTTGILPNRDPSEGRGTKAAGRSFEPTGGQPAPRPEREPAAAAPAKPRKKLRRSIKRAKAANKAADKQE